MAETPVRCAWCGSEPLYVRYHDEEWGQPVHDDTRHFAFLVLESAQAGLSWLTVLRKRAAYRAAYDGFDPAAVARYDAAKMESLLQNPGIIRNRRKIEASVQNARAFLAIQKEYGSFDAFIWQFIGGAPIINRVAAEADLPASTPLAAALSKELKRRGFRFLGPVIVYSYMQAVGLVDDHIDACCCKTGARRA